MKVSAVLVLAVLACASSDQPPLPYATAAVHPTAFPADALAGQYFGNEGFNLQSGYEGLLVPGPEQSLYPLVYGLDLKSHGLLPKVLKNLLALGWKVVPKVLLGAVAVLALFLVGGCVNALVCTFTPLCTISFLGLGVTKETMRAYLTPDRISSTANFVADAIKKYKDMYEASSNEIQKKSAKK